MEMSEPDSVTSTKTFPELIKFFLENIPPKWYTKQSIIGYAVRFCSMPLEM